MREIHIVKERVKDIIFHLRHPRVIVSRSVYEHLDDVMGKPLLPERGLSRRIRFPRRKPLSRPVREYIEKEL